MSDPIERLDEQREAEIALRLNGGSDPMVFDEAEAASLLRIIRRQRRLIERLTRDLAEKRTAVEFFNHTFQPLVGMARLALTAGDAAKAMHHLDKLNDEWDRSQAALSKTEGEKR